MVSRSIFIRPDCNSAAVPTVYVAAKTWANSESGGHWCLTMLRYNYETGAAIGTPYKYPAEPSSSNYFVPTGMTFHQVVCEGGGDGATPADTWIVVTGYTAAVAYGNTDYHTVCFNGNLTVRWSHTYGRSGSISTSVVDEYPTGIDNAAGVNYTTDPFVETQIVGITGNTWNGNNWDIQTIFYDILNSGDVLGVVTEDSDLDDTAVGIRMFGDNVGEYPNPRSYVVGTQGTGTSNAIVGYRYTAHTTNAGSWVSTSRTQTVSGAALKANAMQADYAGGTAGDFAFAAGQLSASGQTHMLLVKLDFFGTAGYYTQFSYNGGSTRTGEALCMAYRSTGGVGVLIALGGYSYRDSSHGNDSCVALFHENSGSPVLRWSAWQNLNDTAYNVQDVCTAVDIAGDRDGGVGSLDDFFVHVACQLPTSTTDKDLRAIVFDAFVSSTPGNPGSKSSSGDPVEVTGTSSGEDRPRYLELTSETISFGDSSHNFIVVGDVYNGSTNGFDVLTRRFRFTEPQ